MENRKNIIDYSLQEQRAFKGLPFNEVDSLILSWVSYLTYTKEKKEEINSDPQKLKDLLSDDDVLSFSKRMFNPKKSYALLKSLSMSNRFKDITISHIVEKEDFSLTLQYASVLFTLPNKLLVLVFRGTNATMNGWKEDLDMSFELPVSAQKEGLKNTKEILAEFPNSSLILSGHSKGGNIAAYAGSSLTKEEQERISGIYSHDGPGFLGDYTSSPSYQNIIPKLHKTIPQSSFFGLMLENSSNYKIVQSNGFLVYQHSPFTWLVNLDKDCFFTSPSLSRIGKIFSLSTAKWLNSFSLAERKESITFIFNIFLENNIQTSKELKKKLPIVLKSLAKADEKDKKFAFEIIKTYASISLETLKKEIITKPKSKYKKD